MELQDDEYGGPRADSLPLEIITHILEFLPTIEDRKAAALVCKRWYEACQTHPLMKREELVITRNEIFDQLFLIDNPDRIYANICARGVTINRTTRKFWRKYSEYIRSLSLSSCEIRELDFIRIITKCVELESLRIHDCRELFVSGLLLESESERASLVPKMSNVKSLSIGYNRYLSDLHFSRLISIFRNLQELLLPGCYISYHSALYNRYYHNGHAVPSENVLTFSYIHEFIKKNASQLKSLSFSETLIDGQSTRALAATENLVLDKLSLRGCVQVTNDAIIILTEYQNYLTHLDLGLCPRLNDDALVIICARLTDLKFLSIRGCRSVTDVGVSDLCKLTSATSLNVSECERLTDTGLSVAFGMQENRVLEELRMSHLPLISERAVERIASNLPNLRLWDVSYCYRAVTDKAVQSISLKARRLNTLILAMCDKLSDRGLTGLALEVPNTCESGQAQPREVMTKTDDVELPEDDPGMFEYKSLQDIINPNAEPKGGSLRHLKHLRHLSLASCSLVSDLTLKFGLKLPDLRVLDLTNCHLVTAEGLRYLSENAKAIETLNLDHCHNVDDTGVGHVLQGLKRLKSLTLGSRKITNEILDHLGKNRGNLRFLDLRHCQQLSAFTVNKIIRYYPHLQVVHFSTKANDFQYTAPPPPPIVIGLRAPFQISFRRPFRFLNR